MRQRIYILVAAFTIALGFGLTGREPPVAASGHHPAWLVAVLWMVLIAPFVPMMAAFLRGRGGPVLGYALACAAAISGGILSVVYAAFSGGGASLALLHGVALTVAVTASCLLLVAGPGRDRLGTMAAILLAFPAIIALWSLTAVGTIVAHANRLAQDRPFCLATHADTSPITAFSQLRGLSFYTTASGYKSTSRWYFHGVLIIGSGAEIEVHNWSPRKLTFDRVAHPERFVFSPMHACPPRRDFWRRLSIL